MPSYKITIGVVVRLGTDEPKPKQEMIDAAALEVLFAIDNSPRRDELEVDDQFNKVEIDE